MTIDFTTIDFALDDALCAHTQGFFETACTALVPHIEHYRAHPLPLFQLPTKTDDIAPMQQLATRLAANAERIIIFGVGGSSLGAQVLAQISGAFTLSEQLSEKSAMPSVSSMPRLIFADNLDATSYDALLGEDLAATRFLVVSKSGTTAETLMQLGGALAALDRVGLSPSTHLAGICEVGDNALRQLAANYQFEVLPHEADIGGRFSILSNVGLLPSIWAGIDPLAVRAGAKSVVDALLYGDAPITHPAVQGAAVQVAHMQAGRMVNVLWPYADRLARLSHWYRQLWAESLGKAGQGSVPVAALGPLDQHSQLQLYLEGADDKFYTILTHPTAKQGAPMPESFADYTGAAGLAGHTMGDLVAACANATYDMLVMHQRPVRRIALAAIDAETIGALAMHFMMETIFTADLLGVNAFDQPAVEGVKKRAMDYLHNFSDGLKGGQ
ncbi:MAG: glucose-6-phosphate isomerase [Parvibaculales bacterium]